MHAPGLVKTVGVDNPGDSDPTTELARFEELARRRRTNLRIDVGRPVPEALVRRLCDVAQWAPNHHRSWPWRFAALTGDARRRLGAVVAEDLRAVAASPEKIAKAELRKMLDAEPPAPTQ